LVDEVNGLPGPKVKAGFQHSKMRRAPQQLAEVKEGIFSLKLGRRGGGICGLCPLIALQLVIANSL